MERAITLNTGDEVSAADMWLRMAHAPPGSSGDFPSTTVPAVGDHLKDIKRVAIMKAFEQSRHNETAAAEILGMSFRVLRCRIKTLGIE